MAGGEYLFYAKPTRVNQQTQHLKLMDAEAHHASQVLRVRRGDEIYVTNGAGDIFRGEAEQITPTEMDVRIVETVRNRQPNPLPVLALSLIKKRDRLEFMLEKAVEIGIQKVLLFNADHSERVKLRKDRVDAILLRAMKQSRRPFLPEAVYLDSLGEIVALYDDLDGLNTVNLLKDELEDELKEESKDELKEESKVELKSPGTGSGIRTGDRNPAGEEHENKSQNTKALWVMGDQYATEKSLNTPRLQQVLQKAITTTSQSTHLVGVLGPEGGLSKRERKLLTDMDVIALNLGAYRLRAETAAILMADRLVHYQPV